MALNILALGIFGSYFGIILGLLGLILRSLYYAGSSGKSYRIQASVFSVLGLVSFLHTWYYMFAFMNWSLKGYESAWSSQVIVEMSLLQRISNWTTNTALFEQAWAVVCETSMNWWWSEQLCLFTAGAWTLFLYVESRRRNIPHAWAYMLLGQFVAISVAANLFYLAVVLHPHTTKTPNLAQDLSSSSNGKITSTSKSSSQSPASSPPPTSIPLLTVWVPVTLSLLTIRATPYFSGTPYFLLNLLTMHALLMVPLLFGNSSAVAHGSSNSSTRNIYAITALASLEIRSHTLWPMLAPQLPSSFTSILDLNFSVLAPFFQEVISTLYSHPAQSSIGFDVVWTTISFLVWCLLAPTDKSELGEEKKATKQKTLGVLGWLVRMLACAGISVGVVAPAHLAREEA